MDAAHPHRMKLAALAAVATLAVGTSAHAQPALTPAQPRSAPVDADRKDPTTATLLSLGGTAASVGLFLVGVDREDEGLVTAGLLTSLVTPSLGHWYAGDYFTPGLGLRLGGATLVMAGVASAIGSIDNENSSGDQGATMFVLGAGLYVGGTLYDLATAGRAAESWNTAHLQFAPTMVSSGAHTTVGLGLGGSF